MSDFGDRAEGRIGAFPNAPGMAYRVWAPDLRSLSVEVGGFGSQEQRIPLDVDKEGYWSGCDPRGRPGDLYRFALPDGSLLPDAATRFQPQGVHGPSECIDPSSYRWDNDSWIRPGWKGQTTYEMHVGTFSPEGSFLGAIPRLEAVAELGAEAIELMPVSDFAGDRNWGYDGVSLFAPARCYGRPDDLRALVDAAHGLGLAVILDVVYNHLGPQGNYLPAYCADYFSRDRETPWGCALNLDGRRSGPVRAFVKANAAYWLDEFRFDGLRLDATHAIPDSSPRHILSEIAEVVHARGGFVVAEDERNDAGLVADGIDALWADDFHHQVRVALTGTRKSYFSAYGGRPQDLADALANGWTFRGQAFPPWKGKARGTACAELPPQAFVCCIENHDQVGNRPRGERLEQLVSAAQFRAASMLLCLSPYSVLLFMGQEWAASTPFLFFTNHGGDLGAAVSEGRRRELSGHGDEGGADAVPDPEAASSFEKSKLRWEERQGARHAGTLDLYRACLRERRELAAAGAFARGQWTALAFGPLLAVRYEVPGGERMLLVSLGSGRLSEAALPREASAGGEAEWRMVLGSEAQRFGGKGHGDEDSRWSVEGPAAVLLELSMKGALHAS